MGEGREKTSNQNGQVEGDEDSKRNRKIRQRDKKGT